MAPAPGSPPPLSPLSSSTGSLPAAQDYTQIVRSLQRRSADRLADEQAHRAQTGGAVSQDLEADLRLAAELGQALLREKTALQHRLDSADKAQQKLFDRLGASVKENERLQRRLEETVGSLEQADASNRALLVSLEEDRKTISRLSVDSGKLVSTSATLKRLQRQHEDAVQELSTERKRANAAEAKSKKLSERTMELEVRLKKALEDLEELRQDKVLRMRRSVDALAKARARSGREEAPKEPVAGVEGLSENTEAKELLKMVETLVSENNMLRSESMELHGLLERSRDEQVDLRSAMAAQDTFPEEEEDELSTAGPHSRDRRRHSLASNFSAPYLPPSDSTFSHSASQAFTDYDLSNRPLSPSSTHATSVNRSWAPSAALSHSHRAADLSRTFSGSSFASEEAVAAAMKNSRRRPPPVTSASAGVLNGGKVPVGRGHNRRALSMDVTPYVRSTDDQDRPTSPFTRQPTHRRRASQAPSFASAPDVASPLLGGYRRARVSRSPERPTVTVDSSTQTTPPATPIQLPALRHPPHTPHHGFPSSLSRSPSPRPGPAPSTTTSELSEDRSFELTASPGGTTVPSTSAAQVEQRTAALGQLIDHVAKLLARVQTADIATQEKRLKKQNLPGDVRHLAQANLRDLTNDIDGVRHHFRRVVELERAAQAKEASAERMTGANSNESLVTRRDFVSLVKLLRDLLCETTRLRSIVNRVQIDPSLATTLRELDVPTALDPQQGPSGGAKGAPTTGGLLAPISRLFGSSLSPDEPSLSHRASSAQLRPPPPKRGGSSTVSTATVNVEFGSGTVRHASASSPHSQTPGLTRTPSRPAKPRAPPGQVKRDISSIFAGASTRSSTLAPGPEPWTVVSPSVPTAPSSGSAPLPATARLASAASAASSYIPFGHLLSSYRPALSSTTNAVLDSIPHAPPLRHPQDALQDSAIDDEPAPTLLERQLRPRGLSDSSIRSTFVSHGVSRANPHHRLISPASLALSSEPTRATAAGDASVLSSSPATSSSTGGLGAIDALKVQLSEVASSAGGSGSVSRRPSAANLRAKGSSSRLRESSLPVSDLAPPVPPLPSNFLSTSTTTTDSTLTLAGARSASSVGDSGLATSLSRSPAPIGIAPPTPRKAGAGASVAASPSDGDAAGNGGAAGLFGTMVSSAWGSLAPSPAASVAGPPKKRSGGVGESWTERGRFG
ncbi:hypothetical protein JCM10213v2_006992 [Rhodosporidiobolus nylandii]